MNWRKVKAVKGWASAANHQGRRIGQVLFVFVTIMFAMEVKAATGLATNESNSGSNSSAPIDYSVSINPNIKWGTWDGWGVSLCWWANVFGDRDDLADLLFTTNYVHLNGVELPGLGLNIVRYNAGACSSNSVNGLKMQVSPNIPAFRQITGYWPDEKVRDPNNWDWTVDANQRAMLIKSRQRGANRFQLFSDSPMWWMCANNNPSGAESGSADNLPSSRWSDHALYLATVAKHAQEQWHITFDSVEPFNEPLSKWWVAKGTQEGCHFGVNAQSAVILALRHELDALGLTNMHVSASDENTYDGALATWRGLTPDARHQVGRVNVHGYQSGSGRRDLLHAAVAGKTLWNSEYGEADASGKKMARNLNLDFHQLHPTGWCYWQALDAANWGLIQSEPSIKRIGSANPKYFVLAQYSRHIRPGMTVIDASDPNTVAAYDPAAHKLVLVTANFQTPRWIVYDLTKLPQAAGPVRSWITAPSDGSNYRSGTNLVMVDDHFRAWFPADAIQTFEINALDVKSP